MPRCALVGAAFFNAEHFKRQEFDCVMAVDAGYRHVQNLGIEPNFIVGDFDSLGYVPDHPHVLQFPTRKDESDIELALRHAARQGFDEVIIYGCLGGRLDFSYALYQIIARFAKRGLKIFAIGEEVVATVLVGGAYRQLCFCESAQGTLSLFALSDRITGVVEEGLEYALDNATLTNTRARGVSNALIGASARLSIEEGIALVFFPLGAATRAKLTR